MARTGTRARKKAAADRDNPEWTHADFVRARPAREVVPEVVAAARRFRGKQRAPTKRLISMRLDRDVIDEFRATGPGWQGRINEVLRRAVKGRK
jgi:uncharacterized protein (DUF4415 family)